MSILTLGREGVSYLFCDGCGRRVHVDGGWWDALDMAGALSWYAVPYDYGWGQGWEHFCCKACLDPPEWDDD
jgi:hypothetical protein